MSDLLPLNNGEHVLLRYLSCTAPEEVQREVVELLTKDPQSLSPLETLVPHDPWPKQRAFLNLNCLEAFYGGAAAGGKSEALLMAALQHVDQPGYAALILRKDVQRLALPGGLIPRSHAWLAKKEGVSWNGELRRWTFQTSGAPATLTFGYLQDSADKFRYGSTEFQFIAFDELTEFPEEDYLFLFSRLRKTRDVHAPLRMRSASNPGNVGHAWVKRRFITCSEFRAPHSALPSLTTGSSAELGVRSAEWERENIAFVHWNAERAYIPARIADNPSISEAEYRQTLSHLPPVERERLMHGDWNIAATGLVRASWLKRYVVDGNAVMLRRVEQATAQFHLQSQDPALIQEGGTALSLVPPYEGVPLSSLRRFVTVDPAGTSRERAEEQRGRPASWTVVQVWDQPVGELQEHLLLRHVERVRVDFAALCQLLRDVYRQWRPARMLIENEKLGQAAVDLLHKELPLVAVSTGGRDKVARAAPLIVKLERGEIWLPQSAPWLADFESELLSWTGLPQETCDQIDAAAYAVMEGNEYRGVEVVQRVFPRAA